MSGHPPYLRGPGTPWRCLVCGRRMPGWHDPHNPVCAECLDDDPHPFGEPR